ncbi:MAG: DUF3014 domain-containing protein [Candidatus Aminicenantes bacterium]|nr:DUF3014 domain-containing protein [Candidatus Aminicenantes bacterium]
MDEKNKIIFTVAAFLVVIALGIAIYFIFFQERPEKIPPAEQVESSVVLPEETIEEPEAEGTTYELIDVDVEESDPFVRNIIRDLSTNPKLAQWLMTKDIIKKFTAAVDNIANGLSPRAHIDFFHPDGQFEIFEKEGSLYIDPESYQRYDLVANVFASLDTEDMVILFRRFKPVIDNAYKDLGYPNTDFEVTLKRAINELLEVPIVKDVLLESKVISYRMVDPELEKLSQAQKHLVRMGPENIRKIQLKLREFRSALDRIK